MPSIPIYPPSKPSGPPANLPGYPHLLQTPSGLALLEIQGSINSTLTPETTSSPSFSSDGTAGSSSSIIPVGKLVFPLYDPANASSAGEDDGAWRKRVYLYVGKYQRLTGEVKKLAKPIALLRRAQRREDSGEESGKDREHDGGEEGDALEVAEIVRWKVVFAHRPEPVGGEEGGEGLSTVADG